MLHKIQCGRLFILTTLNTVYVEIINVFLERQSNVSSSKLTYSLLRDINYNRVLKWRVFFIINKRFIVTIISAILEFLYKINCYAFRYGKKLIFSGTKFESCALVGEPNEWIVFVLAEISFQNFKDVSRYKY